MNIMDKRVEAASSEYKELFKRMEDFNIRTSFYDIYEYVSVEELYQAFKARMEAEQQEAADAVLAEEGEK